MPELERMLAAVGEELDWPPTPDLAPGVMERLAQPAPRRRRLPIARRSLALAFAALLLLAGAAHPAVPRRRGAGRGPPHPPGGPHQRGRQPAPPPPRPAR